MRRAWAILLLVVFSLGLVAPAAFAGDPDSNLPPCCRRAGEHKCSLHPAGSNTSGPAFQQISPKCPHYPGYSISKNESRVLLPQASAYFFAGIASHPTVNQQTEAGYRISSDRTHLKRGPPVSIL